MITSRKSIAKVSGTPGKTRMINHFKVSTALSPTRSADWYLVDLPGYGFAKLSKTERDKFEGMIKNYLQKRENLAITFMLIDSRLTPQPIDLDFIRWMGDNELSFVLVFTKTDKPNRKELADNLAAFSDELKKEWAELPLMLQTSASKTLGRDDILDTIEKALKEFV